MRFYVHDFYFEDFDLQTSEKETDFFSSVNIYFNFSPEDVDNGWGDLQHFNLSVCSVSGFGLYFKMRQHEGSIAFPYIMNSLMMFERLDKKYIMSMIKERLESIRGASEKEIMLRAMKLFDWEWESNEDVMQKYYK